MAADPVNETVPEEEREVLPVPRRKRGKKRLILIAGILLFVVAGAGSVFFLAPGLLKKVPLLGAGEASKEEKKRAPAKHGHIYSLDPLIVNLADTDPSRYLKIRIDIESLEGKENKEITDRMPRLRDAILTLLSIKTYRDIYESEGKKKLKEEIIERVNQSWGGFQAKAVYFTEFVIQ
jgi:flagellar protein FliL